MSVVEDQLLTALAQRVTVLEVQVNRLEVLQREVLGDVRALTVRLGDFLEGVPVKYVPRPQIDEDFRNVNERIAEVDRRMDERISHLEKTIQTGGWRMALAVGTGGVGLVSGLLAWLGHTGVVR